MLLESLHRLSAQRASCKQWSTALAVVVLLAGALGKLDAEKLLWAAAPIGMLCLAEAGYAAQERRVADALKGRKANEPVATLPPELAGESIGRMAVAIVSVSIWPFYVGLGVIVAFGGGAMSSPGRGVPMAMVPAKTIAAKTGTAGCGSGGCSVGGGGCGTSGCGAAAGQACGCGGGASKTTTKTSVPQQSHLPTAVGPRPLATVPPGAFGGRMMPGRPPMYAPPGQVAAPSEGAPVAPGGSAGSAERRPMIVVPPPVQNPQPPMAVAPASAEPAPAIIPSPNAAPTSGAPAPEAGKPAQ